MASKAEKRSRKRAGRKPRTGVARTDSGAISRAKTPGEAPDAVARAARMKIFGLCARDASTAEAASVMGRLSLLGQEGGGIASDQYEALTRFAACREQYMLSINAPDSLLRRGEGGASGTDDAEGKARIRQRYLAARAAIQRAQDEHPGANLWAVVQHIVIEDRDLPYMIGDLRIVGNALARHYRGLDRRRAAA
ncbi:UNVERIFIED_ORG: hypothetical protein LHK14_01670 [Roseateles sp. XES5]|nr:hypothetical protein [Roseateles sp. XES5]